MLSGFVLEPVAFSLHGHEFGVVQEAVEDRAGGEAVGDTRHAFDLLEENGSSLRPRPYRVPVRAANPDAGYHRIVLKHSHGVR